MYQYQVTFSDAIKRAFSYYCCFTGRASRSEYWWFALFNAIVSFVISFASGIIFVLVDDSGDPVSDIYANIPSYIYQLIVLLPSMGLCFRRLHDTGRSGWNICWGLLPCIGLIILIVYYCQESEPEENAYGPVPNLIEN